MGKVLQFPTESVNVKEWLNKVTEHMDYNTPIIMAMKLPNGEVETTYWHSDLPTRQELVSHIQIDIMMGVVADNIQYIE